MARRYKKIDSREQAILYWCQRMDLTEPQHIATVRSAIKEHGVGLVERAYAMVVDKEAAVTYSTSAVRIRDRKAYFLWALNKLYREDCINRHNQRTLRQKKSEKHGKR